MEKIKSLIPWPVGGILDWYIIRGFLKILLIGLVCVTTIYVIFDFFDKFESLLKAGASLWTAIRYFAYKLPLLLSRVFGFAVLFAALFSIGMLSRTQEITAMRAGGLSVFRISQPLFACALVICALNFFWNEMVAPIFAREAQYIYKTEVKKREPKSVMGTKDMWLRTEEAFINVSYFDRKKTVLEGVSIFLLNRDFTLRGLIEAPTATWNGSGWEVKNGSEWLFLPDGTMMQQKADTVLAIAETPEDLKLLARDPEEFGFFDLRRQVADLSDKGIDTTEQRVDLQAKMAVPFVPLLMVFLAIPFAVRHGRSGGLAISFGLTMLIGFGYWVLRQFGVSLGHSGVLPGWVAAWLPNITMAMVALYFYANSEES